MGSVKSLNGQLVGLDTAPLIYYIEEHKDYIDKLDLFFDALNNIAFRVVTSTVTVLEVLVHPLQLGVESLAHRYNDILLSSPNISLVPVTLGIAQEGAELRARYRLKTPDAIQLATAISEGATAFITNDEGFPDDCGIEIVHLCNQSD